MTVSHQELKIRQNFSLLDKIKFSLIMIKDWYETYNGHIIVSYSGGLDSTVLLYLVRVLYPDVKAVFFNTGLEFPEIIKFVRMTSNVKWVKPKYTFREVLEKYGYPVPSKEVAQQVYEIRNTNSEKLLHKRLYGADNKYKSGRLPFKWRFLIDAPFKISHKCCYTLNQALRMTLRAIKCAECNNPAHKHYNRSNKPNWQYFFKKEKLPKGFAEVFLIFCSESCKLKHFPRRSAKLEVEKIKWPVTVEEAAEIVYKSLDTKFKNEFIKESKKKTLLRLYSIISRQIPNMFGLWQRNTALMKDAKVSRPDDCSWIIMEAVYNKCLKYDKTRRRHSSIVCKVDGCFYYPPVKGVHTCKYCGKQVNVYSQK